MLVQYLVPHLYEQKFQPKLERRGNRVTSISTRKGVRFRDIAKLLAPSTNLRKFGQLFNLEQSKAHFPFKILNSVNVLQDKALPKDDASWISDISGEQLTPQKLIEIKQEAQHLFDQAKCKNVGDYLKTYLRLDVEILYKASQGWRRQLKQLIKLDFVEHDKFTISSLSYTAGLKRLESDLRLGHFFPNNSQMYRLLRRGMRG